LRSLRIVSVALFDSELTRPLIPGSAASVGGWVLRAEFLGVFVGDAHDVEYSRLPLVENRESEIGGVKKLRLA
jgi:hypothetical protein